MNKKLIIQTLTLLVFIFFSINSYSQNGLNFQGVARTSNNIILASQSISIRLSILRENTDGTKFEEYVETRKVFTNAQGLFTAVIGDTGAISRLGNFANINWKLSPKFLKIEMDPAGGNNFINMGTTQFQYVAYAQFAKSVDAENIVGIVPVTLGGTGVASMASLKTALTLNNVNNTADLNKPISTLTQTALDLKLNAADTSKYTKLKYTDSIFLTKLSTTGNAVTATTAENITAITNSTLTSLSNLVTVGTITSGVWSGTAVAVEKGGTGATTAATARTNLGLVIGTNVQAPLVPGTDYLTPTGNAATATTAGNITATSNTTLTSLSNLSTVGTITSGVWSGTAVAVEKGGTGATTLTVNGVLLGNGTSSIQALAPGASGNVLTSNGTTWISAAVSNYTIGANATLGGYIFFITPDGKHGLVAATQNQSTSSSWFDAQEVISNPLNHNTDGKNFTDWRLPNKYELSLMYNARANIGGFANAIYWSSTIGPTFGAWDQDFLTGNQHDASRYDSYYVRAIRTF